MVTPRLTVLCCALAFSGCDILGPNDSDLAGNWMTQDAGSGTLRLAIEPVSDPANVVGSYTWGSSGPVTGSVADGDVALHLHIGGLQIDFYGRLESGSEMVGTLQGGGFPEARVTFRRGS